MKKIVFIMITLCFLFMPVSFGADNVISISSAEELAKIGNDIYYPLNGEYVLKKDITLNSSWTPIAGNELFPFSGKFNGQGNKITLNWNADNLYIFKYLDNSKIQNLNIEVFGENARTTLAYMAKNSDFYDIKLTGLISKENGQIGGLVWVASGSVFTNIYSSVDIKLTSPNFSQSGRYNILGGIVSQISAEAGTYPWSSGEYAIKFINCSYSGNISVDLNNAIYSSTPVATALWIGNIYGATAYDSPASYFGVYFQNCRTNGKYNINGTLNKNLVSQYNFIDNSGDINVTYIEGNKSTSAKIEEEIVRYGRTHQNIHLTAAKSGILRRSFGYFGETGSGVNEGDYLWSYSSFARMSVFVAMLTVIIIVVMICYYCFCYPLK